MREKTILFVLLLTAIILFFWQPSLDWKIQKFIYHPITPKSHSLNQDLLLELDSSRAKNSVLGYLGDQFATSTQKSVTAPVYAKYPFNNRGEIAVMAGTDNGVAVSQPVMAVFDSKGDGNPGILIGTVTKVSHDTAVVQTLYDQKFQLSVKIGNKGVNALFTGGLEPKVGFISKDAEFSEGDNVWSADPSMPYGSSLGIVKNIGLSADKASREALIVPPYELSDLRVVRIIINHDATPANRL